MTTAAAPRQRAAHRHLAATAPRARTGARTPRLLLPPVAEDRARQGEALAGALATLPHLRSVRSAVTEEAWVPVADPQPVPRPLDDPTDLCGSVVVAAVEALAGVRAVAQLARWVTPEVYDRLAERASGGAPAGRTARRATFLRSTVCRVTDTVAEAAVIVHDGRRVRAAAVRLEEHRGRWRVTVLQIG